MNLRAAVLCLPALLLPPSTTEKSQRPPPEVDASVPPVDASVVDSAPAPGDAGPDSGLCNGTNPGYVAPPFKPTHLQACTAAQIDAYTSMCGKNQKPTECQAWFN